MLKQVIQAEIHSATGSLLGSDGGGDLADRRREAMEFYLSEPFGNEVDGRSQVVDSVVHDVIESALPNILEIFTSSDEVVRFEPVTPDDEDVADQATDYVNYIMRADNDQFRLFHWWIKDAFLQKNGICKVWWEVTEKEKRVTSTNLSEEEVDLILSDDDVEPIEHDLNEDGTHNLTILRKPEKKGRVKVENIPPEEFLIARRAVHVDDCPFICHRVRKSISDLIEEGYDPEQLEHIPSHDEQEYNEERLARFEADDEWPVDADSIDPAARTVWIYECYLHVDYDGDGVTELRQVTVAGPGYELLSKKGTHDKMATLGNDPIDDLPFVSFTPIPMPHKFFGMSLADETMDIQLIKSTILRQLLDNMYLVNNGRTAVNERVELDDWLVNRPGGVVRVKGEEPIGNAFETIQTQPIGPFGFPLLEYMDGLRENRTGITRYNQGLDADSLNKTATGIDRIMSAAQKRQQLIARIFAETGVKPLMKKILHLVIKHQDKPRVVRLRDEWVQIDPRSWNAEMDVIINVGLGHGTKEQELFAMQQSMAQAAQIVQLQGGAEGPLITWKEIYNSQRKFLEAAGMRDTRAYVADPEKAPPQAQQLDPQQMQIQAETQLKAQEAEQKLQLEIAKLRQDDQHHIDEMALKSRELDIKAGLEAEKLATEEAKSERDTAMKGQELKLKRDEKLAGDLGTNLEALEEARLVAVSAAQSARAAAEQVTKIVERVKALEAYVTAPKSIEVIRGKDGRVKGGVVEQGGVRQEISIQ